MIYVFHRAAIREFNEAIDFYEKREPGLGTAFSKEVHAMIQRIIEYPASSPMLTRTCRRCLIRRFPYGIIYEIVDEKIVIIAVMQLNRKPEYWRRRLHDT